MQAVRLRRALCTPTEYPCTMRYEWMFLDADGTLLDYDAAERAALSESLRQIGVPYDDAHLQTYRLHNAELWEKLERAEVTRDTLQSERFRRLFDAFAIDADPSAFNARYLENLGHRADLIPGARAVLDAVRNHVELLLITNGFSRVQRSRLAHSGLLPLFASIVISEEVGSAKPDAAMFDAALRAAGAPRRETVLMVGDSLSSDIRGGIACGLDTCWYNPARAARPPDVHPTYEIGQLRQLANIVTPSETAA